MKIFLLSFAIFISQLKTQIFGQEATGSNTDSIEVFIIDSYVPPENPNRFILSFYTSVSCKTKLVVDYRLIFSISEEFTDNHRIEVDIAKITTTKSKVNYVIQMENEAGIKSSSEVFELELSHSEVLVESKSSYLFTCLTGGVVFLTPTSTAVHANGKTYFGLNKEFPVLSFYSGGFNYPSGYLSVEYAHILKAEKKNYFRLGYKHIYEIPKLEYLSVGLNGFTDFRGFNGISPELSIGLFKIYNVFTFYSRYRYNFSPGKSGVDFSEFSIGLYSSFFTLHW